MVELNVGGNVNNIRFADDTVLLADSKLSYKLVNELQVMPKYMLEDQIISYKTS